ncbi:extracellular polysaccharide biosynthesis protein [Corynebacterium suranareeae]|uniref:Extracellular polysaccharide biosynthesis protein n=1 Tax=Corynebacterium suranareeae TaxID=2506452 RepID=A0A169SA37_9CORY|nr:antibiotic biosynthesis monooxygenase [Corynebacterium suranareeae]BAU97335.1 extracellular polysaccharide biosynthesis protein [Corynebacterium suranareeae]
MSIVKINAISVPEGAGEELEKRFAVRQNAVDSAPGFEGFQLLRPVSGEDRYFVVTQWADEDSYNAWRDAEKAKGGHGAHGSDKKPVASGATLLEFEVVLGSKGAQ